MFRSIAMLKPHLQLSALIFYLDFVAASGSQCFLPNGTAEGNLVPCNGTASVSACCAPGDTCVSNGLCKNSGDLNDNYYWRDGCTDQSWGRGCPQICAGGTFDANAPNMNYLVQYCEAAGNLDAVFCCEDSSLGNCCTNSSRTFTTLAGTLYAAIAIPSSTSSAASSSTTSSPLKSSTSTSTTPASIDVSTTTSASSSSQTSTQHRDSKAGGLSSGAKAGIGVGVALGVLAFVGVLVGFWFAKRRQTGKSVGSRGVSQSPQSQPPVYTHEKSYNGNGPEEGHDHGLSEMSAGTNVQELEGQQRPSEAPTYGVHEQAHELALMNSGRQ